MWRGLIWQFVLKAMAIHGDASTELDILVLLVLSGLSSADFACALTEALDTDPAIDYCSLLRKACDAVPADAGPAVRAAALKVLRCLDDASVLPEMINIEVLRCSSKLNDLCQPVYRSRVHLGVHSCLAKDSVSRASTGARIVDPQQVPLMDERSFLVFLRVS